MASYVGKVTISGNNVTVPVGRSNTKITLTREEYNRAVSLANSQIEHGTLSPKGDTPDNVYKVASAYYQDSRISQFIGEQSGIKSQLEAKGYDVATSKGGRVIGSSKGGQLTLVAGKEEQALRKLGQASYDAKTQTYTDKAGNKYSMSLENAQKKGAVIINQPSNNLSSGGKRLVSTKEGVKTEEEVYRKSFKTSDSSNLYGNEGQSKINRGSNLFGYYNSELGRNNFGWMDGDTSNNLRSDYTFNVGGIDSNLDNSKVNQANKEKSFLSNAWNWLGEKTPQIGEIPIFIGAGGNIRLFDNPVIKLKEKSKEKDTELYTQDNLNIRIQEFNKKWNKSQYIKEDKFVGTETQYKDYSKEYENLQNWEGDYKENRGWKEGAKSKIYSAVSYLPETYGQVIAVGASLYGGVKAIQLTGSAIASLPKGVKAGLAVANVGVDAYNVKQTFNKDLSYSQRIGAGAYAGIGITILSISSVKNLAKIREINKLKNVVPEYSLGVKSSTAEKDVLEIISVRRTNKAKLITSKQFDVIKTSEDTFQIQAGYGAQAFYYKNKAYLQTFQFFGEGQKVSANIIKQSDEFKLIKPVGKNINPTFANIKLIDYQENLIKTNAVGFSKQKGKYTQVLSNTVNKGFVNKIGEETLIDIATNNKEIVAPLYSNIKANVVPKNLGLIKDLGYFDEGNTIYSTGRSYFSGNVVKTKGAVVGNIVEKQALENLKITLPKPVNIPKPPILPSTRQIKLIEPQYQQSQVLNSAMKIDQDIKTYYKINTIQKSNFMMRGIQQRAIIQAPIQIQLPIQANIQLPAQVQLPIQKQIQQQVNKITGGNAPTINPNINIPINTKIPKPQINLPLGLDAGGLKKKRIKVRKVVRYTPSYSAVIYRIFGKQPKGVETGLRLRPIPKGINSLADLFSNFQNIPNPFQAPKIPNLRRVIIKRR